MPHPRSTPLASSSLSLVLSPLLQTLRKPHACKPYTQQADPAASSFQNSADSPYISVSPHSLATISRSPPSAPARTPPPVFSLKKTALPLCPPHSRADLPSILCCTALPPAALAAPAISPHAAVLLPPTDCLRVEAASKHSSPAPLPLLDAQVHHRERSFLVLSFAQVLHP